MTGDEEAPEELLEAARIRRDFLAHMRHELRTPLNAIIGYGEMLLEDAAEQGRRAFIPDLEKIRVSGQQLLALVNDILAPAKMRAGEVKLDLETFRANLRHELRTPLNAIIGYSEMLLEDAAEQGQQGFAAESGAQALQMMRAQKFVLVLLDVMMPEMDGHEVLEHLRGNEAWRDIPVIMISALDELDSIVRCIEMGAEDYLPKPFNTVLLR